MSDTFSTDHMLITRCQNGDRHAFDSLINTYSDRAYKFAYKLTRNSDEASDVVAEGFVRVYKGIARFKGDSAFSTWLYRILTNCFLDMRKKAGRHPTTSLDCPTVGDTEQSTLQIADCRQSPYDTAESAARARRMVTATDAITDYQKSILCMYHGEMLSYVEIADTLKLPIGTVKSRLNRARTAVRSELSREQDLFLVG